MCLVTGLSFVYFEISPYGFDLLTRVVNRVMGSEGDFETAYITRSEVREVTTAGQRAGVITPDEHRMLQRLLRFRNRIVKETMVPRRDVVAVSVETDAEAAIDTCLERELTQLPVYEDVLDTLVGTVHIRDLIETHRGGPEPHFGPLLRRRTSSRKPKRSTTS